MYEILGLKTLITTASLHIRPPEMAVFGLFFLIFVLVFFFSVIFWRYRLIFALCLVVEGAILAYSPFGVAYVMRHFLYPISVHYTHFSPFVYTHGFLYDIEIKNNGKIPIKECMLTITPMRENPNASKLIALKNTILPQAGYTQVLAKEIAPKEKVRFNGIIDDYHHDENYQSIIDCH